MRAAVTRQLAQRDQMQQNRLRDAKCPDHHRRVGGDGGGEAGVDHVQPDRGGDCSTRWSPSHKPRATKTWTANRLKTIGTPPVLIDGAAKVSAAHIAAIGVIHQSDRHPADVAWHRCRGLSCS
jgi:hypothetical protein